MFRSKQHHSPRSSASAVLLVDGERIHRCIRHDPLFVKAAVLKALEFHHAGAVDQPPKAYLRRGESAHTADRIIAMPAYLRGEVGVAGVKWIGSNHENFQRGLPRANALLILSDTTTNAPIALMSASLLSAMRTLAVGLIAIDRCRPTPRRIAILGMGRLGHLFAEFLPQLYPSAEEVRCYSARAPFNDTTMHPIVTRVSSHAEAVRDADLVVATTSANEPYINAEDLPSETTIINLSLMDFSQSVFAAADTIVVDDWDQCARARKVFKDCVDNGSVVRDKVHELSSLLFGPERNLPLDGLVMVNTIGMAIEDVCVAQAVYERLLHDHDIPVFKMEEGDRYMS